MNDNREFAIFLDMLGSQTLDASDYESDLSAMAWQGTNMDAIIAKGEAGRKALTLKFKNDGLTGEKLQKAVTKAIDFALLASQKRSYKFNNLKNVTNDVQERLNIVITAFDIKFPTGRPGNSDMTPQRFVMLFAVRVALLRNALKLPVVCHPEMFKMALKMGIHPAFMFSGGASLMATDTQMQGFCLYSIGFTQVIKASKGIELTDKDFDDTVKFTMTASEKTIHTDILSKIHATIGKGDISMENNGWLQIQSTKADPEQVKAFKATVTAIFDKEKSKKTGKPTFGDK